MHPEPPLQAAVAAAVTALPMAMVMITMKLAVIPGALGQESFRTLHIYHTKSKHKIADSKTWMR